MAKYRTIDLSNKPDAPKGFPTVTQRIAAAAFLLVFLAMILVIVCGLGRLAAWILGL